MKTQKNPRVTFSAHDRAVNIALPKGWGELTDEELALTYRAMATYPSEDIRFYVFKTLSGMSFVKDGERHGKRLCVLNTLGEDGKVTKMVLLIPVETLAGALTDLDWLHEPGNDPVRVETLRGRKAVDRRLRGVPFDTYLKMETLYQGFLISKDPRTISGLLSVLYSGWEADEKGATAEETLNVVQWVVQLKNMFREMFTHLFAPVGDDGGEAPDMVDVVNNQIRILTGGDVTKEDRIREIDCWRALTELDYKAMEADEMKKEYAKLKK